MIYRFQNQILESGKILNQEALKVGIKQKKIKSSLKNRLQRVLPEKIAINFFQLALQVFVYEIEIEENCLIDKPITESIIVLVNVT